ncbi:MAG: response regulator transcription factor [Alphaproteobacteria bacterium]|nr:response regulator transcription factor [Alphaproteobacteria bacterium]MBV8407925.1 response regulator transcription factor [Alphaproteobacteria bacterium]
MTEREEEAVTFVIDDDELVRASLADLLRSVSISAQVFASPREFLDCKRPDTAACIVLDVRLPGGSGLEFQRALAKAGIDLPVIFITGHGDIPMSVRAMKTGAVAFLTKPLREQELLDAVYAGIERDRSRRTRNQRLAELRKRLASLTTREREVLPLVVSGRPNKQIAEDLKLSEMTVKVHRSHIMRKMQARSLVDLVRMADQLGVSAEES